MSMLELLLAGVAVIGVFVAVRATVAALVGVGGNAASRFLDDFVARLEGQDAEATSANQPPGTAGPIGAIVKAVIGVRRWIIRREQRSGGAEVKLRLNELQKADIDLRPSEWLALRCGAGLVAGGVIALRTDAVAGAALGVLVATVGARSFLRFRQARRARKLNVQLGHALMAFASALRSGNATPAALRLMARGSEPPLSSELSRMIGEQELGVSLENALQRLATRNNSEELDLVVAAMQINQIVGGNLAEIADNMAETIRERVRIKGEIRVLTAQARTSGWIISILPLATAAILTLISPDYFTPMFHQLIGWIMIGMTLVSMVVGALIIRKIVTIRV